MSFQISKIIIGMVFVSLIVTGMILFLSGGTTTYPSTTGYNNSSLVELQSSFDDISVMANETKSKMGSVQADDDIFDRIGVMFTGGYTAAKTVGASYDTLNKMSDVAVDELPLGSYGSYLKSMLGVIILVIIFVAILLHFLIKSDRL